MRRALAVLVAVLAAAPPAVAGEYDPGSVPPEATGHPKPSGRVVHVGRGGLQAAIDRARAGDTVRIPRGTYRGDVVLRGGSRRGVRLVADGAVLRGTLTIRDTASIAVRGLRVSGGSLVVRDADRYVLDRVRVTGSPGNGIDVRRSLGGVVERALVRSSAGAGIAVGGSPASVRAVRTFVRDSTVDGAATGVALDRLRAVTVTRVRVLRAATGVAASAVADGVVSACDLRVPTPVAGAIATSSG